MLGVVAWVSAAPFSPEPRRPSEAIASGRAATQVSPKRPAPGRQLLGAESIVPRDR